MCPLQEIKPKHIKIEEKTHVKFARGLTTSGLG